MGLGLTHGFWMTGLSHQKQQTYWTQQNIWPCTPFKHAIVNTHGGSGMNLNPHISHTHIRTPQNGVILGSMGTLTWLYIINQNTHMHNTIQHNQTRSQINDKHNWNDVMQQMHTTAHRNKQLGRLMAHLEGTGSLLKHVRDKHQCAVVGTTTLTGTSYNLS